MDRPFRPGSVRFQSPYEIQKTYGRPELAIRNLRAAFSICTSIAIPGSPSDMEQLVRATCWVFAGLTDSP